MQTSVQFFVEHAGYSFNPAKETAMQGRYRTARRLARAERLARIRGFSFHWTVDPVTDSRDFSQEDPPWKLWACTAYDPAGKNVAGLGAIDFGRDGEPWGRPYRRVVEAELAAELL